MKNKLRIKSIIFVFFAIVFLILVNWFSLETMWKDVLIMNIIFIFFIQGIYGFLYKKRIFFGPIILEANDDPVIRSIAFFLFMIGFLVNAVISLGLTNTLNYL